MIAHLKKVLAFFINNYRSLFINNYKMVYRLPRRFLIEISVQSINLNLLVQFNKLDFNT